MLSRGRGVPCAAISRPRARSCSDGWRRTGAPARYPWNPNGSEGDIAGLTNPEGNVFGLMPHPERAFFREQAPDWSRSGGPGGFGDGRRFLAAVLAHAARAA